MKDDDVVQYAIGLVLFIVLWAAIFSLLVMLCRTLRAILMTNVIVLVTYSVFMCMFSYEPRGMFRMLALGSFPVLAMLLVNIMWLIRKWEKVRFRAFLPLSFSILTIPVLVIAGQVGDRIRLVTFNDRLPQYEEAVSMMASRLGNGPVHMSGEDVPHQFQHLASDIWVDKENGQVIVTFARMGAYANTHWGYAHIAVGLEPQEGSSWRKRWKTCSRVDEQWFRVAD